MDRPIIDAFVGVPVLKIECRQRALPTYEMFSKAFGMPLGLMVYPSAFYRYYETYTELTNVLPGAPFACGPINLTIRWRPYSDDGKYGSTMTLEDTSVALPDTYDGTPEMWFRLALVRAVRALRRVIDPGKFDKYRDDRIVRLRRSAFARACACIADRDEPDGYKREAMTVRDVELKLLLTVQRHLTWFDTWKKDGMPICFDGIHTKRVGDK